MTRFPGRDPRVSRDGGAAPIGRREGFLHGGHRAAYRRPGVTVGGASAYKGGDGPFTDVPHLPDRSANAFAWARAARAHRLAGLVATAWSRYTVMTAPCETIEASLIALAITARALAGGRPPADPDGAADALPGRRPGRAAFGRSRARGEAARNLRDWAAGFVKWFLDERERTGGLAGDPGRMNPGQVRALDRKIDRQLAAGRRHGAAFIRAHRGLVPGRWLRGDVASRIQPLARRAANARRAAPAPAR